MSKADNMAEASSSSSSPSVGDSERACKDIRTPLVPDPLPLPLVVDVGVVLTVELESEGDETPCDEGGTCGLS